MREILNRYTYFFFLTGLFILSEIIVNPIGDFPLNDDWTYGKSTLIFQNEGKVTVGDFAAMTLLTHVVWGFLFTKLFWFSFTILRLSTLLSSLIGLFALYRLVSDISRNQRLAFLACLALLFNPLYFNLTNTYMTDVNFNTLLLLCCYFANDFFQTRRKRSFILVFVLSALLVLIRQFGIIVPVCFAFASFFLAENRWKYRVSAILLLVAVYAVLKYYEHYLKGVLPPWSAYKFSGNVNPASTEFWDTFCFNWKMRYKQILLNILLYASPFAVVFLNEAVRRAGLTVTLVVAGLSFLIVHYGLGTEQFPIGNVFNNMSVGTETFYESLHPEFKSPLMHTHSETFAEWMFYVKYIFMSLSLVVLVLGIINVIRLGTFTLKNKLFQMFLLSVFFSYILMILITESYFDRYHIPVITMSLLLFSYAGRHYRFSSWLALPALGLFFYISVAGTKDYLELNRTRWQAYHELKEEKNLGADKINGGFEVNCWNDGQHSWWYDFFSLNNYDFLIQHRPEPGFKPYREYEFQRYFPYRKDTVRVFIKEETPQPKEEEKEEIGGI